MTISKIIDKLIAGNLASIADVRLLLASSGSDTDTLYRAADSVRKRYMGDEIYLRGIIEFSNYCRKDCNYCGIRRSQTDANRYRIPDDEIIATCRQMLRNGQTTVVLQSGEDIYYTKERFGILLERIKAETGLAITVSVGERDEETYRHWKANGMDRYLLRFETSNREIFDKCHPDNDFDGRIACLHTLRRIGVQTGSGFLIGLPNETLDDLADDILFCTQFELDMIGVGPFIPNDKTPFKTMVNPFENDIFFKTISVLRLLNKDAHIPATTAFDAIDANGRNLLLQRGCNVFMPNATPGQYRKDYLLYPGKPCVDESSNDCAFCVQGRIALLGRSLGKGPGHSIRSHAWPLHP